MGAIEINNNELTCLLGLAEIQPKVQLWSLVLQAVNVRHELVRGEHGWDISVKNCDCDFARHQITSFEVENQNWPPPQPVAESFDRDDFASFALMSAMVLFFSTTGPWSGHSYWFETGAVSGQKILGAGEWWRLLTGLTLHADAAHLLGNVFFGGLLLHFLSRQVGAGNGCLLAVFSGIIGNGLNVYFRHEPHLSVGFSTAVFGMVGAFGALRWFRYGFSIKEFLVSIGAAVGLLAILGAGGERTDLGAHFWGMAAGVMLGAAAGLPFVKKISKSLVVQGGLASICVAMVLISWYYALLSR
jgi:rhomboid protease GluP